MAPRPFTIEVPDAVLDDLRERLERTRWPESVEGGGWSYGVDVGYVRELCEYWATTYDWRSHERLLNAHPGFLCEIDGTDVHFWHVRGKGPAPFPLLLVHGWPGSIFEFAELIGPLTDPAAHGGDPADAFDVVVPALPGFGFGGAPRDSGWGIPRIADAFHSLMRDELGYERYGVQGGDWGCVVAPKMAAEHGEHIVGIHVNMVFRPEPTLDDVHEQDPEAARRLEAFQATEIAYALIQATKPDSLTVAQSDSPAGLAAWMLEKFRAWSDWGGDVERSFSRDTLLTNLMFYWAPNRAASAARIYRESHADPQGSFGYPRLRTPTGVANFPADPFNRPRSWAEARWNVTHWTDMPRGGHFAALEEPQLLLEDVRTFFRTVR
jgi:pimeloyl-ACP methyl ester carboxylesterase